MRYQLLLRWLACFIVCFLVVYMLSFASGRTMFEDTRSALMGASVALMLSSFTFGMMERNRANKVKIKELEDRIRKLEGKKQD